MTVMTSEEFVNKLLDVANNYKTIYIGGTWGWPMNEKMRERAIKKHPDEAATINRATDDTFAFDCVCLVKGILWGWCGDKNQLYGGAGYACNGVPDIGTEKMISVCADVSTDFTYIEEGELVWLSGHVGVYVGNGKVVECTGIWGHKVIITDISQNGVRSKDGKKSCIWAKHGKLPYITYTTKEPTKGDTVMVELPILKKGSICEEVRTLQILLNGFNNAGLTVDGDFGNKTDKAVREYQRTRGLSVDGIVGEKTWNRILK